MKAFKSGTDRGFSRLSDRVGSGLLILSGLTILSETMRTSSLAGITPPQDAVALHIFLVGAGSTSTPGAGGGGAEAIIGVSSPSVINLALSQAEAVLTVDGVTVCRATGATGNTPGIGTVGFALSQGGIGGASGASGTPGGNFGGDGGPAQSGGNGGGGGGAGRIGGIGGFGLTVRAAGRGGGASAISPAGFAAGLLRWYGITT